MLRALALLLTCVYSLSAQDRVPSEFLYERIVAIVPIIGQGSDDDPVRPMFAPKPGEPNNFVSVQFEVSDDGKSALVEFVAKDSKEFKDILAARGPNVKVFERNKNKGADVEQEFGKVKRNYKFHTPGKDAK